MKGDIRVIMISLISIYASVKIQEVDAIMAIGTGVPVPGSPNRYEKYVNTCGLVYKKHVENKPDVFVAVTNEPGLCLITRQANVSDTNYQWQILSYAGIPLGNATKFVSRAVAPPAPGDNSPVPTVMVPIFDKPIVSDKDRLSNFSFFKKLNIAGINYDSQERWLFFLLRKPDSKEERELYRANINGTERKVLFSNKISTKAKEDNVKIKKPVKDEYKMKALTDIAYDWISKNVYFSNNHEIYAINALNAWDPIRIVSNRSQIISPVVHPNFGNLYFVDYNRTILSKSIFDKIEDIEEYAIYRINLDGSNLVKISETSDDDIVSLAIDFHTNRLYWSRPNARIIQHSDLDGSDIKNIIGKSVYYGLRSAGTHSIGFDKNYVYYIKSGAYNSVQRFNKTDNKEDEDYYLTTRLQDQLIFELVIFDVEAQKIRVDHPCFKNNGGCQKFCFAVPKEDYTLERICKCSLGEDLEDDGVSCRLSVL